MPLYEVTMLVEFRGEIEADTPQEAEDKAIYDDTVFYEQIDSIEVAEIEEYEEDE